MMFVIRLWFGAKIAWWYKYSWNPPEFVLNYCIFHLSLISELQVYPSGPMYFCFLSVSLKCFVFSLLFSKPLLTCFLFCFAFTDSVTTSYALEGMIVLVNVL